jgi:hypothetical protein
MSIVEPDEPFAIRTMQRERVVDAMRLLGRHRHPCRDEPDPLPMVAVHHENLLVEVEKPSRVGSRGFVLVRRKAARLEPG